MTVLDKDIQIEELFVLYFLQTTLDFGDIFFKNFAHEKVNRVSLNSEVWGEF